MTTRLLIIRHGNTFTADEEPRRVGCRTDIPLVPSGIEQAKALGGYLNQNPLLKPDAVFASALQRAQETAIIMAREAEMTVDIQTDGNFNEIDHGLDENKTEVEILERIGQQALDDWNAFGVVPHGWKVDPRAIQHAWVDFAEACLKNRPDQTTCVVSSGGIIRFAPVLLKDPIDNPKVKTASMSLFEYDGSSWQCAFWNQRP